MSATRTVICHSPPRITLRSPSACPSHTPIPNTTTPTDSPDSSSLPLPTQTPTPGVLAPYPRPHTATISTPTSGGTCVTPPHSALTYPLSHTLFTVPNAIFLLYPPPHSHETPIFFYFALVSMLA